MAKPKPEEHDYRIVHFRRDTPIITDKGVFIWRNNAELSVELLEDSNVFLLTDPQGLTEPVIVEPTILQQLLLHDRVMIRCFNGKEWVTVA